MTNTPRIHLRTKAWLRITRPIIKVLTTHPRRLWRSLYVFQNPGQIAALFLEMKGVKPGTSIKIKPRYRLTVNSGDDLTCIWNCWVDQDYPLVGDESVIIDAGANIGAFATYAYGKCPKASITAFEPVESTYTLLSSNIRDNAMEDRVILKKIGLASVSGSRKIFISDKSPYSGFYSEGTGENMPVYSLVSPGNAVHAVQGGIPKGLILFSSFCTIPYPSFKAYHF